MRLLRTMMVVLAGSLWLLAAQELATDYPGTISEWNGGIRHDFQLNGVSCIVVEPRETVPGKPWYWKARFWDAFPYPEQALLARGWTIAYTDVAELYGAPEALRRFDRFYRFMTAQGYHPAPAMGAYSRGGLIAINFASRFPDRLSCLYLDNAVCDYNAWPGGGRYPDGWQTLLKAYHFDSEEEARNSIANPATRLETLARSGLPVLAVCALKDRIVPPETNTLRLEEIFHVCGGRLTTIFKPEADHHPHSLEDPAPIVQFIENALANWHPDTSRQSAGFSFSPSYRCQYLTEQQEVLITLWQWPEERRLFLSGIDSQPGTAWLESESGNQPLPVVSRSEGWYLFLPEVPPATGDQRIHVKIVSPIDLKPVVSIFDDSRTLLLTADNGIRTADGGWEWKLYLPLRQDLLLKLEQPSPATIFATNGGQTLELSAQVPIALLPVEAAGLQTISVHGVPPEESPRLMLLPLEFASLELFPAQAQGVPSDTSEVMLGEDSPAVSWALPLQVPLQYQLVAEYACETDCRAEVQLGHQNHPLLLRASGTLSRIIRQPIGRMSGEADASQLTLRLISGELKLRLLMLTPEQLSELQPLYTGEEYDVQQADSFTLPLPEAKLQGMILRVQPGAKTITHWYVPTEFILWPITNVRPGRYRVSATIGTVAPSCLALNAGGRTLFARLPSTNDYDAFQTHDFGVLEIPQSENVWLQVFPAEGYTAVNLGSLRLERVE